MSGNTTLPTTTTSQFGNGTGTIVGTNGNDSLGNASTIYGLGGDDVLYGISAGDALYGGEGNDVLYGGNGVNLLDGGNGNNTMYGGPSNDVFVAGTGNNTIYGNGGVNVLVLPELKNQATITLNGGSPTISGPIGTETTSAVGVLQFLDGTLATDPASNTGQVYRLYQAAFDRAPDAGGLGYWTDVMNQGTPLTTLAQSFASTSEFQSSYGAMSNGDYVNALYLNVLGRSGDASGASYWTNLLDTGSATRAQVLVGFSQSSENETRTDSVFTNGVFAPSTSALNVLEDYQVVLGHLPDPGGLQYFTGQIDAGSSNQSVIADLMASPEYTATFGSPNNAGFVQQVIQNSENTTDAAGASYWTNLLNNGAVTRVDVAAAYARSSQVEQSVIPALQNGYAA